MFLCGYTRYASHLFCKGVIFLGFNRHTLLIGERFYSTVINVLYINTHEYAITTYGKPVPAHTLSYMIMTSYM